MLDTIQNADESIIIFVAENMRRDFLNGIMIFITKIGDGGALWLLAGIVLMIFKDHRRSGYILIACVVLCTIVNTLILKNLICRPRPFDTLPELVLLINPPGDYSFPSGHAASSLAAAFALTYSYGWKGAVSYIPAVLIAISRIYVGVHYPGDVAVGAVIGTGCAWAGCTVLPKILK